MRWVLPCTQMLPCPPGLRASEGPGFRLGGHLLWRGTQQGGLLPGFTGPFTARPGHSCSLLENRGHASSSVPTQRGSGPTAQVKGTQCLAGQHLP